MATPTPEDDLFTVLGSLNPISREIEELRGLQSGYRAEAARFQALADEIEAKLAPQVELLKGKAKDLSDALSKVTVAKVK